MLYVDYNVYYNVDNNTIYSQNKNSNPVVASPSGSVGSGADRHRAPRCHLQQPEKST